MAGKIMKGFDERSAEYGKIQGVAEVMQAAAHEFNNMLQLIRGNLEIARKAETSPEIKDIVNDVICSSDRMAEILRNLQSLSINRTEISGICAISECISSVLKVTQRYIERKNIKITTKLAQSDWVKADGAKVRQAFLHMITNACDAMHAKDGKLVITVKPCGETVETSFEHAGSEPFFTARCAPGSCAIEQNGIGLYISYEIIKEFKGSISVHNKAGNGTEFVVSLPRNA